MTTAKIETVALMWIACPAVKFEKLGAASSSAELAIANTIPNKARLRDVFASLVRANAIDRAAAIAMLNAAPPNGPPR
jgi:hypothetical protein